MSSSLVYSTIAFPATQTSCLFYCHSAPNLTSNRPFSVRFERPQKPRLSLKSGNPLTFTASEGDLTPSDFELNVQREFAKTDTTRFSISAKRRPSEENERIPPF